jgi:hypothetical protein
MRPNHRKSFSGAGRRWISLVSIITLIIAACMVLDALRPKITSIGVSIDCPGCPNPTKIYPADVSDGPAPTVNVRVKNEGRTQATYQRHQHHALLHA